MSFDREFWEQRWVEVQRDHGDKLAGKQPSPYLVEVANDLPPGRVLDAGCGHGAETFWLAARGWHVTAVDFSTTALDIGRAMATDLDVVHCHTWYSHFAGCLVKQLQNVPLVLTTHSLEPHRPWKVEQLGTAYHASSWLERTAYQNADGVVAVSVAMKNDVQAIYRVDPDRVRVIHNGIDLQQYRPRPDPGVLAQYGIRSDAPFVLFVDLLDMVRFLLDCGFEP